MDIKKTFDRELNRPMNRREFLARIGGVTLTLLGVAAVLKSLQGEQKGSDALAHASSVYGVSTYGR